MGDGGQDKSGDRSFVSLPGLSKQSVGISTRRVYHSSTTGRHFFVSTPPMAESLAVALQNATIEQPRAHLSGLLANEIEKLQKRIPDLIQVEKRLSLVSPLNRPRSSNDERTTTIELQGERGNVRNPASADCIPLSVAQFVRIHVIL